MNDQQHRSTDPKPLIASLTVRRSSDRGSQLVQNHERRIPEERARKGDALDLAGRERPSTLADCGVVPLRQGAHEDVRTRTGRRGLHRPVAGGGQPEPDVVCDAAAKERRLLRHPRDLRSP
jgi:hypothetical protein